MLINTELEREKFKKINQQLIEYFKTGYEFEEFLKQYLIELGLDEVEVTKRSRDGGVDLKATKKGFGNFDDSDITNYYIQAKKYKMDSTISVKEIRELKGTLPFGYKGLFITTAKFSAECYNEAKNDISKLVVLVDGEALINSCIEEQIGFVYKPEFSTEVMDKFWKKNVEQKVVEKNSSFAESERNKEYIEVEKVITKNDVKVRILSIPSSIFDKIDLKKEKIDVIVNNQKKYELSINKNRKYLSGVTDILKEHNLMTTEGIIQSKNAKWKYNIKSETIHLEI